MNNKLLRYLPASLLALAFASFVTVASAEPEQKAPNAGQIKRFDKNKDGQLDDEELANMKKVMAAELAKYDANGNGKIDAEERAKIRADNAAAQEAKKQKKKKGGEEGGE